MPDLKTSPLQSRHVALGAKFAEFGGWSMPLQYGGIVAEHKAVRDSVGVFDVSHLGKARLVGGQAVQHLLDHGKCHLRPPCRGVEIDGQAAQKRQEQEQERLWHILFLQFYMERETE